MYIVHNFVACMQQHSTKTLAVLKKAVMEKLREIMVKAFFSKIVLLY